MYRYSLFALVATLNPLFLTRTLILRGTAHPAELIFCYACHPAVFNTYTNIQCISQRQQILMCYFIIQGNIFRLL